MGQRVSEVCISDFKEYDGESDEDHAPQELEEDHSKEEEIEAVPVPLEHFSRTRTRNSRSRKSRKAARRCYTLLIDMDYLPKVDCGCCHGRSDADLIQEDFPPLAQSGMGSIRAECHSKSHLPIGEGPGP